MLDPEKGLPPEARAVLRSKLGLPAATEEPPKTSGTNAPPVMPTVSTNAPKA